MLYLLTSRNKDRRVGVIGLKPPIAMYNEKLCIIKKKLWAYSKKTREKIVILVLWVYLISCLHGMIDRSEYV